MTSLKLDENLSRHLATALAALGHDAHTVGDEGPLGEPDPVIARAARAEGRMLFTLDREFADLRKYPPGSHPGVVLFRPRGLGPLTVSAFVETFARDVDVSAFAGCVVVVDVDRIRVRRPGSST